MIDPPTARPPALTGLALLCLGGCAANDAARAPDSAAARVLEVADAYYEWVLETTPERGYFAGVPVDRHDELYDNSPDAVAAAKRREDRFLASLETVDPNVLLGRDEWIVAAMLVTELRSSKRMRICRRELWNVSQMGGWHSVYARLAGLQPVGTEEMRRQALARWSAFPRYVDNEIASLRTGVELGYSAPKPVVRRVIAQVDGLLAPPTQASPFYSPAARDDDAQFAQKMAELVDVRINPALARYRDYLENEYLPAARSGLSVTLNPDGRECYAASLRRYTTLDATPEEISERGQAAVARNRAAVIELGRQTYGLEDFVEVIEAVQADPADRFDDGESLLRFSRQAVERAEREMPAWVGTMPGRDVEVVPFPAAEEGTGRSAHYRAGSENRPAEYRIPLAAATEASRGNAEVTAFHETWPGHHLQVATAQSRGELHPATQLIWFSGPGEGWARYSEALAGEMGLYRTKSAPILRRAWPARGMVVDPGIHLYGWSREEAKTYMLETGRFPASEGDAMVDRIAILPGQLTAYDAGALEILALRAEAEKRLGERFDIREFHDRILENGTIPLAFLRQHVEAWLDRKTGKRGE